MSNAKNPSSGSSNTSDVTTDRTSAYAQSHEGLAESHFETTVPGLPVVPGYTILREIGRGGMGVVYAATDPTLERIVAVKVLKPGCNNQQFIVESKVTAKLSHPGIPPVYSLGEFADKRPFLAMKLIEGENLNDLLRKRNHDHSRLVSIFESVCQTVGFAHSHNIIHRDLKPANIMVGEFGEVYVMDWGLSRAVRSLDTSAAGKNQEPEYEVSDNAELTAIGTAKGTPAYMAPEQARGEHVDARADVFALGGLLLVMLTGKPPFQADSALGTVSKARIAELSDAFTNLEKSGADGDLILIAKKCLAALPQDRYANAQEVGHVITAYRDNAEARVQRAEREAAVHAAEAKEQRKRRKVQLAFAAAVAMFLVACAGFIVWQQHERQTAANEKLRHEAERERIAENERNRLERNREMIAAILDQAEAALRDGQGNRAAVLHSQAMQRIAEGGAEELQPRVAIIAKDLDMLKKLDAIDRSRWTVSNGRTPSFAGIETQWKTAFAAYGIVPGVTPVAEVSKRLQSSHIRTELLTAIEVWFVSSAREFNLAEGKREKKLLAILQANDPDPFRNTVREAFGAETHFTQLWQRDPNAVQPVWFAIAHGGGTELSRPTRERLLTTAYRQKPNTASLLLALGQLDPANDRASASRRAGWYHAAVSADPQNPLAWNNLGTALLDSGDVIGALASLNEAIRLDPQYAMAHNNLGNALTVAGKPQDAIRVYRHAIQLDQTDANIRYNLGTLYLTLGDFPVAVAELK